MDYKITHCNSPNYSNRAGYIPDMIVNHVTCGSYQSAISWLTNPKSNVSAHFVVSKRGEITQLVPLDKAAWANGTSLSATNNLYYMNATNSIVKERKANANLYTISIEYEGYTNDNGILTNAQFEAAKWLYKYIADEVNRIYGANILFDIAHIIGHCHIAPKTKPNCPGRYFPYNKLITAIKEGISNGSSNSTTTNAVSVIAGQMYDLYMAKLYTSYDANKYSKLITGKYYIYDGVKYGNRYRITDKPINVKRTPVGKYVIGYIDIEDLK